MESKIFQVLSEAEPFSAYYGGGTSRWTANVVKDDEDTIVLCPEADDTWGFSDRRVRLLPGLVRYRGFVNATKHREPWIVKKYLIQSAIKNGLQDLNAGDIVWIQNRPEFAAALSPLVKKRGARLVLHMHNSHIVDAPSSMIRNLGADRIVFCSKFLRDESLGKHPYLENVSVVVPNGADNSIFFPLPAEQVSARNGRPPVVLFVGRIIPQKGVHVLVEAMRLLHEKKVPAVAKIVGGASFGSDASTPYLDELRKAATPNVQFCGYLELKELGAQFRDADILCCPSVWHEAFGAINVEAMASALPVVATHTGGIPEVFFEGGAILVAPNSSQELAAALELLALDPGHRSRLAREGYTSFQKNFTWQAVHHHYRNVIESLRS